MRRMRGFLLALICIAMPLDLAAQDAKKDRQGHAQKATASQPGAVKTAAWLRLCQLPLDPDDQTLAPLTQPGTAWPSTLVQFANAFLMDSARAYRAARAGSTPGHFLDAYAANEQALTVLAGKHATKGDEVEGNELRAWRQVRMALYLDAANALRGICVPANAKCAASYMQHRQAIDRFVAKKWRSDTMDPQESSSVCAVLKAHSGT